MNPDAVKLLEKFDAAQPITASPLEAEIVRLDTEEFKGASQLSCLIRNAANQEPERDPLISAALSPVA